MQRISCDVVVVGGGSAGAVVAGRLGAETDAAVVLLEAGPDYGAQADGRWPADLLDGGALAATHNWDYTSGDLYPGREPIPFERARVIGGCSSHNGCAAVIGTPDCYDRWARLVDEPGWTAASLAPLIASANDRMRVRTYGESEISPFHAACLGAAEELGMARTDDLMDINGGLGYCVEAVNVDHGVRFNSSFAYIDPARHRPNLRVIGDALVVSVIPKGDRVEVVAATAGGELRVDAGRAVLAAGAYGTPSILMRSGIGDPEDLKRIGVETVHALAGVGRNLHDHAMMPLEFAGSAELDRRLDEARTGRFVPEEQTLGKIRSSRSEGLYDLHIIPVKANPGSILEGMTLIAAAHLEPWSRGSLWLTSTDPEAHPVIDHGYLNDPDGHDLAVLREGVETVRAFARTDSLRGLIGPETSPGAGADLDEAIRRTHVHYYHPVGTAAMGPASDPMAVCDGRARLHGLEQIMVADCALMPIVPRANTNIPAVVVGERVADWLCAP